MTNYTLMTSGIYLHIYKVNFFINILLHLYEWHEETI